MVFSDEPGVYFDGKFGIRIEDTICLQDGQAKTFMEDDKKLIIVNNGKIKKYLNK
jgi:Xaa-Pro aminopeptidase